MYKRKIGVLLGLTGALLLVACSPTKNLPVEKEIIRYVDSVRYEVRDSVVEVPVERVVDVVPLYDTLRLETSVAEAEAYVDTVFHALRGNIRNKSQILRETIRTTEVEYRDSVVYREVPVPYEVEREVKVVPKFYRFLAWYALGVTLIIMVLMFLIFKK